MAFKIATAELAPGQTAIHWFSWGKSPNRKWKGIQVYAAKPVQTPLAGPIIVGIQQPSSLRVHDAETLWSVDGYTYRVQVTNGGPGDTRYELWGESF